MRYRVAVLTKCLAVTIVALVAVAGCGSAVADKQATSSRSAVAKGKQTAYPLAVESCGVTQTYDAPPQRAVTLTSTATETMLELGLGDRMVGTAYLKGRKIGPQYKSAYDKIPVLAAGQPSMEQLLAANPDFVYAGYGDGFSASTGHTRQQLQDLGIKTHLSPVGCTDEPKTLQDMPDELKTIGKIFNVNAAAEKAVKKFDATVDKVKDAVKGSDRPKVFLYNSGTDAPQTVGGWAYASVMIDAAGGRNILADEPLRWGKVSWEQVAAANPDIILIYDYLDPSVESKIATLKDIPALADTTAIKKGNFATISLSLAQPGPRSAEGVEQLAEQFHPDLYPKKK
ncbi:iron complex transport system substrate-binding protein [Antricoccus suffuscus]|uniref:Iron complex transport system substrate-binding protein n=1 Tax=Antricoccus suffuscus TaxID=1629062 RepID=A0A2T1A6C8_9ACTN|nr:ABC transporter substrate-binding protein [Antricoccus suffuscus]PRZ44146.1 iron complex transport system substrate-binding protein [Antricoccus suffuscus]